MHELLRHFSTEKLSAEPETQATTQEQHSTYYLAFINTRQEIMLGKEQRQAVAEISLEFDNIQRDWQWAVQQNKLDLHEQAFALRYQGKIMSYQESKSKAEAGRSMLWFNHHC
jgi:hypothetical protein